MNKFITISKKKIIFIGILIITIVVLFIFLFAKVREEKTLSEKQPAGMPAEEMLGETAVPDEMFAEEAPSVLDGAEIIFEGVDLISKEGKVVSAEGLEVRTDVRYDSVLAPQQSLAMSAEEKEQVMAKTINLEIGEGSFSPDNFSVKKGQAVSLVLTGTDNSPHVFRFIDSSLQAVYININERETRLVVFNAPEKSGDYSFRCDFPGHLSQGERGVMTVK